ncbi:hypothetical protein DFQ13_104207 [Actinokineospora spheciospongiae]|nr:hypothetical protein DFQ13_104207 [Actinokineospora spheciospongiae]
MAQGVSGPGWIPRTAAHSDHRPPVAFGTTPDGPGYGGGVFTEGDRAARSGRARDAAVAAARGLGLTVRDARVLHDVFSVVVRLDPAPVVARVPVVVPRAVTPAVRAGCQRAELAVTAWLAGRGAPTVVPSPLVPAEPVRHGGFAMTFWERVDGVTESTLDLPEQVALTARLHSVLRDYPGEPRLFAALEHGVEDGFHQLADRPDLLAPEDVDRARREWAVLGPLTTSADAFRAEFPDATLQPVHGDAPYHNLIETPDRVYHCDFEHVMLGPVEWDLTHVGARALAAYDAAAAPLGLRPADPRLLRAMVALRDLQMLSFLALAPEMPLLVEGLQPMVAEWRGSEFAGGLG